MKYTIEQELCQLILDTYVKRGNIERAIDGHEVLVRFSEVEDTSSKPTRQVEVFYFIIDSKLFLKIEVVRTKTYITEYHSIPEVNSWIYPICQSLGLSKEMVDLAL